MNQYPKRLIEVDLPIRRISAHARREASTSSGHIKSLHVWWARRPLAACRAVLCSSLWFDPADEGCPDVFRVTARDAMRSWGRDHRHLMSNESFENFERANRKATLYEDDLIVRTLLLDFIADFANWDNSTNQDYLTTCRKLTEAAHFANGGEKGSLPLVLDPFAGGGAIPLEASRIGADAFASDLNPIPVLLNKVALTYIPRHGKKLADEVKNLANRLKNKVDDRLRQFYPPSPDGSHPSTYIWARTINCEGPGCGVEFPLLRSLCIARRGNKSINLKFQEGLVDGCLKIDIATGVASTSGTVSRGTATCPTCGYSTPVSSVRRQLRSRRGGSSDARLLAVQLSGNGAKKYRLPTERDFQGNLLAVAELRDQEKRNKRAVSLVPDEPLPPDGALGFRVQKYGIEHWNDLFTPRQSLVLSIYAEAFRELLDKESEPLAALLIGMGIGRIAVNTSTVTRWRADAERTEGAFGMQTLQMVWDFGEPNPIEQEGILNYANSVAKVIDHISAANISNGTVQQLDASQSSLPDDSCSMYFTDPPYYDAISYADLSDFFYVWLKRVLGDTEADLFRSQVTPKAPQAIMNKFDLDESGNSKTAANYEQKLRAAFAEGRRVLAPNGIGCIVFAHKSTAGWESLLDATIQAGWTISGSWPLDTELGSRLRALNSAALGSSIHLILRPREDNSGSVRMEVGDWRDVLRELPVRIHQWMPRLAKEGVVGADAIFACLGPALEIFSRYSTVEKPNGEEVNLREYLEYVWAAVAKEALDMIFAGADATGFEEDARLSAMWLWTLFAGASTAEGADIEVESEQADEEGDSGKAVKSAGYVLEYDAARKIAQGLGAHLEDLTSIVEVKGDKARLLPVSERARDLFGYVESSASEKKRKTKAQKKLFEEMEEFDYESTTGIGGAPEAGATTLDRIHQAMLLFGAGRSEAVRRFLVDDGVGNDERFWRLANALSALYPSGTDEKRWVDGVLARKKGLGF